MNVNIVNSSASFGNRRNLEIKKFSTQLFDGNVAKIRMRHEGNSVNSLECYTFGPDGSQKDGKAFGKNPSLPLAEIAKFLSDIQEHTSDNVFNKFYEAILK